MSDISEMTANAGEQIAQEPVEAAAQEEPVVAAQEPVEAAVQEEPAEAVQEPVEAAQPALADVAAEPAPAKAAQARGMRKTRVGVVISDKMDKTITVAIKTRVKHPLYGKIMNRTTKLKAHDEKNACGMGDTVRVMETRPLSRDKRWRLVEIIEKAK